MGKDHSEKSTAVLKRTDLSGFGEPPSVIYTALFRGERTHQKLMSHALSKAPISST